MSVPVFSVIIVNYNGGEYLQRALDSLKIQTFRSFEVIVVDNASDDPPVGNLDTDGLPAFTLMAEPVNHGFAKANNMAAKRARGEWLVLLNPDAEADPDWLEQIMAARARHPGINVFASTQLATEDDKVLDGVGDAYLVFGFPWRGGFGMPRELLPQEGFCFSPCGASGVYRRDRFLAFNGFDERFFCYCEDVDLGYRMQLGGEKCVFVPAARIRHAGSAISGRHSEFSIYHGTRNRLWTYAKCTPIALLVLTVPVHLAITTYVLVRSRKIHHAGTIWRALRDATKNIREIRAPGPWSAPRRKVSLIKLSRAMAWNPLRMSRRLPHVRPLASEPH